MQRMITHDSQPCNLTRPLTKTTALTVTTGKRTRTTTTTTTTFIVILLTVVTITLATTAATTQALTYNVTRNAENTSNSGNRILQLRTTPTTTTKSHEEKFQIENIDKHENIDKRPIRYDGTQLWRINKNQQRDPIFMQSLANILESRYGGNIWKDDMEYLDISIAKDQLLPAQYYLKQYNISSHVLNTNIQDMIDLELLTMHNNVTQNELMGQRVKRAAYNNMNWNDYHDINTIYNFMREIRLQYPQLCRLYTIGKTAEGRSLKVIRISENPRENKKFWIDGGIHAREWVSPSTVTFILYQLMTQWNELPDYMRNKTWYFMPVVNPDGYEYTRTVNRLWRKNRSRSKRPNCIGVDLNRNFDVGWLGKGASDNPCSDIYRGSGPASELETEAVTKFLVKRKYNLKAYLTFHSYGQLMVYPWAFKPAKVKDANDLHKVAETAVQRIKKKTGAYYQAAVTHEVLGIAGGGSDDWARFALCIKYVYTVELRDRGGFGFVLPPNQIMDTALEGYTVVDTVAQAIV